MLRPKLNRIWATTNSVSRRDPGDAKYIQGWISEIPTYQVLNYLQYKVDTTLLALAERGVFEWGGDVQYGLNSVVWNELDRKIYVAIVGNPDKTKAPSANLSQWSQSSIQIPRASYDAVAAAITAHIADITGNPHQLTAGRLGAYNKAEIDALVLQYRQLVAAHAGDKSNPHGVTAAQAGAVPVTGGTYTGDVTFNGGLFFDAGKVNQVSKTNGLYLQTGLNILGINASGVAVAGTTTSASPIVTEQTFPDLKAAREVLYATPEPSFQMSLLNSIMIRRGSGLMSSDFNPTYSASMGAIVLTSDASRTLMNDAATKPVANNQFTVAVDVISVNFPVNADSTAAVTFAIESVGSLSVYGTGEVVCNLSSGNVARSMVGPMSSWTRLAMTYDGTNLALYVDGVLRSSVTAGQATTGSGRAYIRTFLKTNVRQFYARNWRIWQSDCLNASQVSTL